MARNTLTIRKAVLLGLAGAALSSSGTAYAQDTIGGFDTSIKKEERSERPKREKIVYVNQQAGHPGPKTLEDALDLVKPDGEIVIHPGEYRLPKKVSLRRNVSIRGLDDDYGNAPVMKASNGCLSLGSETVSARVSNLTFRSHSDASCINVSGGRLHMVNTQILGRRAGRHNIAGAHHIDTGDGIFIPDQAINTTSALVSITGGDVTISGGKIEGGTTGVLVDPRSAKLGYQHVEIERAQIVGMEGAGVVIKGEVDAVMSNNHVLSNGMGGIVFAGSGYAQFVGNTISNNSYNGLYIQGSHEAVSIKNNMIHDNTQNGILLGSGTAVLVANDIGVPEDGGCQVRTRQVQNHVNITLYDNDQGTSRYDMTGACSGAQAEKRKPRSGWFGRKSG